MDDLSGAIREIGGADYTVTRGSSTMVGGYPVAGAGSSFTVCAVEQPLTGDELARLPEGLRTRGVRGLVCDQPLLTEASGVADVVTIDGVEYEVQTSKPWTMGNFYEVVVARRP